MESEKEYLFVTEYFHPDTASTSQLLTELTIGLENRGLDISVLTSQPNYHSGENEKQPLVSTHEGVLVKRIRAPQVRQTSLLKRLYNWTVFTVWAFFALLFSRTKKEREIVFVSNPPFLPIAMWLVCNLRGWSYTYIVHDLYPDQPVELGYIDDGGFIDNIWTYLNSKSFENAEDIVALGPVMKDRISRKMNISSEKITIIHNWADGEFIKPKEKTENWFSKEHNLVNKLTILYSGNIGEFHDLESLIKAAEQLENDDIDIFIIGEGDNKETLVEMTSEKEIKGDMVEFLPYQPKEDLPYSLTSGDISVVTVKKGFKGVCVSSKLYTAMASGMPILGIVESDDDEALLIETFDAGIHVEQGNTEGIIEAINTWRNCPSLMEKQGKNARKAFENHFTKATSIDRYHQLLTGSTVEPDVTENL